MISSCKSFVIQRHYMPKNIKVLRDGTITNVIVSGHNKCPTVVTKSLWLFIFYHTIAITVINTYGQILLFVLEILTNIMFVKNDWKTVKNVFWLCAGFRTYVHLSASPYFIKT